MTTSTLAVPIAPDPTMRWGIQHQHYPWHQCRFCGRDSMRQWQTPTCRPGACLACGSRQCNNQPECRICLVGIMPDWSGWQRACGYAGCPEQAVAKAPRVKWVCARHLDRPKRWWGGKQISVADDIAERLAIRDGRIRERFPLHRYVLMPEVQS